MIGAIIGDIIGSPYEYQNIKTVEFSLFSDRSTFTDDSVTTIAIADAIMRKIDYGISLKQWGRKFPSLDYGDHFRDWLFSNYSDPYNSWGNGSAMRVSPVGFLFNSLEQVLNEAKKSAEVTHNHPEGIKGAQATASAIFLARNGSSKSEIKEYIEKTFQYDLSKSLNEIRPLYEFDVSCQGSVPQAITAFLEGNDFEDTIRKAVSIGGDSDTIACIAGGIAEAFFKDIPLPLIEKMKEILTPEMLVVMERFNKKIQYVHLKIKL